MDTLLTKTSSTLEEFLSHAETNAIDIELPTNSEATNDVNLNVIPSQDIISDSELLRELAPELYQSSVGNTNSIPSVDELSDEQLIAELLPEQIDQSSGIPAEKELSDSELLKELAPNTYGIDLQPSEPIPSFDIISDKDLLDELVPSDSVEEAGLIDIIETENISDQGLLRDIFNASPLAHSIINELESGNEDSIDGSLNIVDYVEAPETVTDDAIVVSANIKNPFQEIEADSFSDEAYHDDQIDESFVFKNSLEVDENEINTQIENETEQDRQFKILIENLRESGVDPDAIEKLQEGFNSGIKTDSLIAIGAGLMAATISNNDLARVLNVAKAININENARAKFVNQLLSVVGSSVKSSKESQSFGEDQSNNGTMNPTNTAKGNILQKLGSLFGRTKVNDDSPQLKQIHHDLVFDVMNKFTAIDETLIQLSKTKRMSAVLTMKEKNMSDDEVFNIVKDISDDEANQITKQLVNQISELSNVTDKVLASTTSESDVEFVKKSIEDRVNNLQQHIASEFGALPLDTKTKLIEKTNSIFKNITQKIEAMIARAMDTIIDNLKLMSRKSDSSSMQM